MSLLDRQFLINNVIDRIEALERKLRALEDGPITEITPDDDPGGLPISLVEGPDIDVVGSRIGRGGDTILVFDSGGDPLAEFAATEAGLVEALSAAGSGDTVVLPSVAIAITVGLTLGAGVALVGMGQQSILDASGFSGTAITMAADAICYGFSLTFVSNGTTALGIDARFARAWIERVQVTVSGGSATNIGINAGASLDGPGTLVALPTMCDPPVTVYDAGFDYGPALQDFSSPGDHYGGLHVYTVGTFQITHASIAFNGQMRFTLENTGDTNIKVAISNPHYQYLAPCTVSATDTSPEPPATFNAGSTVVLTGTSTDGGPTVQFCIFLYSIPDWLTDLPACSGRITKIEVKPFGGVFETVWQAGDPVDCPVVVRCFVQAAGTGAKALAVDSGASARAYFNALDGEVYDLDIAGACAAYGNEYENSKVNGALTFSEGDRAAYDVESWHASDIEAGVLTRHTPFPLEDGELMQADGGAWISAPFDWDVIGAATDADMVHSHTSDAEGGALTGIVGADHTHAGVGSGGQLDWDNIWTDAAHNHSAAGEGGQLAQANTHESADTDAATTSLHHTIGATATTAAAGNHTHAGAVGELLMQDGVTAPPVPVENEARDDWLYEG